MRTFGSYDLIAPLASGGMAQLWLARSPGADGIVVLKRLLRDHLGEPALVTMFDDEGHLGELLRHPNLVRQYEHGNADGEPFIVLEYLQGEDVHAIRRHCRKAKRSLPLEIAIEIVRRLCEGLHAAHELLGQDGEPLGVVHRDVSPQNTIVTFDGIVKVVDFGIAKRRDRQIQTRDGMLKGKVPYMAPEQIQVEPIDRRTDLYAVGVMLYELTVGERPYIMPSPSEFALMMAIVRGEVKPPRALRPLYPPALEAIVLRALSVSRDSRPRTAAELAAELDAFRRGAGLPEGPKIVAEWMAQTFAERVDDLRKAKSEQELVARILDAEKRKGVQREEDDDITAAQAAPSERPLAGVAYVLTRRPLGAATLATLQGRINETFDGGEVGRALSETPLVVLDLAGIERLTSYGVREWLAMLEACRGTELWLSRCSEPVLAQLATIKGFAGHARVASLLLPFHCETCGGQATKPFDLEIDQAELASGRLAPIACKQCAGEATFDDDPSWLLFAKPWLGEPVPAVVRAALAVLARDSAHTPPAVEKVVLGTETLVRIRNATEQRIRFRKLFDGVEGRLRVEVREPTALDERSAGDLARSLAALGREVTAIEVRGAPPELWTALQGNARVHVASRFVSPRCPACNAPRPVIVPAANAAAELPPCPRCNGPLVMPAEEPETARQSDPTAVPARDTPLRISPVPASSPRRSKPASLAPDRLSPAPTVKASPAPAATTAGKSPPWARALPFLTAAVLYAAAVLVYRTLETPPIAPPVTPAPVAPAASTPVPAVPSAAPAEEVRRAAGSVEIVASGTGPSEDEALAAARARANVLLLDAVREALSPEVRAAVDRGKRPMTAEDPGRRLTLHLGAGASPERADARVIPAAAGHTLSVRFRLSEALFQKAIAYWGTAATFRGLAVVPAFPTVAEAGWLVVAATPGKTAVRPGDVILAVGSRTLSPTDHPSALSLPEPELHLARGDVVEVVHWLP